MLLKAEPIIDTVEEIIKNEAENSDFSYFLVNLS